MGCGASTQPKADNPAPQPISEAPGSEPAPAVAAAAQDVPADAEPSAPVAAEAASVSPNEGGGMGLVVMGPPASGKGEVLKKVAKEWGFVQLSTSKAYRYANEKGLPGAEAAKPAPGDLPDELKATFLSHRIKEEDCATKGWLLDGFPRTQAQAELLSSAGVKPKILILIDLSDEIISAKLTLRRVDPMTHKMYHLKDNPPPDEEVSNRLMVRNDDQPKAVKELLEKYHDETDGVLAAWNDIVLKVPGCSSSQGPDIDKEADAVAAQISALLKK